MALTIPIGLLLRQITQDQLALLDAKLKQTTPAAQSAPAAELANQRQAEGEGIELEPMPNNDTSASDESTADEQKNVPTADKSTQTGTDAIAPKLVLRIVDGDGANGRTDAAEEYEGLDNTGISINSLATVPADSKPPILQTNTKQTMKTSDLKVDKALPKKTSNMAAAFAYFKHMPALFKNPTYLIHALHFAVIMGVDFVLLSVSFDSFLKDMKTRTELVFTMQTVFAAGNFTGRFASGLFVVMPVLMAKCRRGNPGHAAASQTKESSIPVVRIVYCCSSAIFCLAILMLTVAGLSGGPEWSWPLVFVYLVIGLSAGCLFSQFPVVLTELIGVQRLAAGHALFMLIQTPVSSLSFISGIIKQKTGTWAIAYMILFIISIVITLVNCVNLMLSPIQRLLFRKSVQPAQLAGRA